MIKKKRVYFFVLQSLEIEKDMIKEGPDFFQRVRFWKIYYKKILKKVKSCGLITMEKILALQKRQNNDAKVFLRDLLKNNINSSGIPKGLKKWSKEKF